MHDVLVVVDMQNDFIDGSLGTSAAQAIVDKVADKIRNFAGDVLFTQDTHGENYLDLQEGINLPVEHCICNTYGWELNEKIAKLKKTKPIEKNTFGSVKLGGRLTAINEKYGINSITLVGLCTDICIISNAMLIKAFLPEVKIIVDSNCCAGTSPESHERALKAMKMCQIEII